MLTLTHYAFEKDKFILYVHIIMPQKQPPEIRTGRSKIYYNTLTSKYILEIRLLNHILYRNEFYSHYQARKAKEQYYANYAKFMERLQKSKKDHKTNAWGISDEDVILISQTDITEGDKTKKTEKPTTTDNREHSSEYTEFVQKLNEHHSSAPNPSPPSTSDRTIPPPRNSPRPIQLNVLPNEELPALVPVCEGHQDHKDDEP